MGSTMRLRGNRVTAVRVAAAVAMLLAGSLLLFWPGFVAYDSLSQYKQALSGTYDDWHPPAMAHLWALFGAAGPAPLLIVQMGLYWLGLGALAVALTVRGRRFAALAVLALALWPPLLGWQAVVLKDTQMLGAMLGGVGLIGWWRLRDRSVPAAAWAMAVVLFAYALLVRANAPFAVIPLVAMLAGRPRAWLLRLVVVGVGIVAAIGLAGPINHGLLKGAASGVERTQAIYDLTGIAVRSGDADIGLPARAITGLRVKHCVRPFFWDPLGDPAHCADETEGLHAVSVGTLYGTLALAIVHHPFAYAAHRLAHLNSTERWLVPLRWYGAAPPAFSEPNAYGFGEPGKAARRWQGFAAALVETPLGWPILWVVLGVAGFVASLPRRDPTATFAAALFASALVQEASFAVISIASDLRYHLWSMTAVAIGWIVIGRRPRGLGVGVALAVVLVGGVAARMLLPEAAPTYAGMLG